MVKITHYLPAILLCLSTTPCFSALKQDTNSQSLISFRDFSQQMPKSNCRMSAVDDLKKKKKKSFEELKLKETNYGYSIDYKHPFLAMEISPSKETAEQIRWVAPSRIKGSHVKAIVLYLQKYNQSIHINTGGHGGKDGTTVFDDPCNKAEVGFIKEDIQAIWNIPNVSFHTMSSYSSSIYPRGANHVIDAWCYSLCTSLKVSLRHFSPDLRKKALIAVAANDCLKIVKYLLPKVSQKEKDLALIHASKIPNNLAVIKELLPHAKQLAKNYALEAASKIPNNLTNIKYLLPHADKEVKNRALWAASKIPNNRANIKELLLAKVKEEGFSDSDDELFASQKDDEAFFALQDAKKEALWEASQIPNNLAVIQLLLPHADQKAKKEALEKASQVPNNLAVIQLLLPHATQYFKDKAQSDALIYASQIPNNLPVIQLLYLFSDQYAKNQALINASQIPNNLPVIKFLHQYASQIAKNLALEEASQVPNNLANIKELTPHADQYAKDKALIVASKIPNNLANIKELAPHATDWAKNIALEEASQVPNNLANIKELTPHASQIAKNQAHRVASQIPKNFEVVKYLRNSR